jgi:hypothetical protein
MNIKFCVRLGKNESDTCTVLSEACGGETIKKSSVFECQKWFKEGYENVEDRISGCPISHRTCEYVGKVQNLLHSDC